MKNYESETLKQVAFNENFLMFAKDNIADIFSGSLLLLNSDSFFINVFVHAFATLMLCEKGCGCGKCQMCVLSKAGTNPDLLIYPKGDRFTVSDSESIVEEAFIKPMLNGRKFFVLKNLDGATEQAQNKLLKILEEPPKNVVFIVAGANENKILVTVRSRLNKYYIKNPDEKFTENILTGLGFSAGAIKETLKVYDGKLSSAISLLSDKETRRCLTLAEDIVSMMKKSADILGFARDLSKDRETLNLTLYYLNETFSRLLFAKENINIEKLTEKEKQVLPEFSTLSIVKILEQINEAKKQSDLNVNPKLISDKLLFGILELKYLYR